MPIKIPFPAYRAGSEHNAPIERNALLRSAHQNLLLANLGADCLGGLGAGLNTGRNRTLCARQASRPIARNCP